MKRGKLMTHIVAGYPSVDECEKIALLMAKSGVSFIEIQIPFSDPVADGPTIMAANQEALENGVSVKDCFLLMKKLRAKFDELGLNTELLFMSYYNILHSFGVEKFCMEAKKVGCYGFIVPDIPFDEEKYEGYLAACKMQGLKAIQVISPLTNEDRLNELKKIASGFVYCVSRFGTTGTKAALNPKLSSYLRKVKKHIKVPLAVGFGISNRKQIAAVHRSAEIAVIGSKFIKLYEEKGFDGIANFLS